MRIFTAICLAALAAPIAWSRTPRSEAAAPPQIATQTPSQTPAPAQPATVIDKGDFRFAYDARGVSALANPHDPFGATLTPAATTGGRGAAAARRRAGGADARPYCDLSRRRERRVGDGAARLARDGGR